MSEASKAARAAMKAKIDRLVRADPKMRVDASGYTPPDALDADVKTGARPVSDRLYGGYPGDRKKRRKGGKVFQVPGTEAERNLGKRARKARASGGNVLDPNCDVRKANESRAGTKHVGAFKDGGKVHDDIEQDEKLIHKTVKESAIRPGRAHGGNAKGALGLGLGALAAYLLSQKKEQEAQKQAGKPSPPPTGAPAPFKNLPQTSPQYNSATDPSKNPNVNYTGLAQSGKPMPDVTGTHDYSGPNPLNPGNPGTNTSSAPAPTPSGSTFDNAMKADQAATAGPSTDTSTAGGADVSAAAGPSADMGADMSGVGGEMASGGMVRRRRRGGKADMKAGGADAFLHAGKKRRKSGGKAMNVNIIIGEKKPEPHAAPPMGLGGGMPPPMPPKPMGPPPGAGGPPPMMGPGGPPPPTMGPPGPPPMGRKSGGRAQKALYTDFHAAGGGMGRLEKIEAYGNQNKK